MCDCRVSSLGKLAWRADKLQSCMQAAISGPPEMLPHAPAWLFPASHLRPATDGSPFQEAWLARLWREHIKHVMQRFQELFEMQLEVPGSLLNDKA